MLSQLKRRRDNNVVSSGDIYNDIVTCTKEETTEQLCTFIKDLPLCSDDMMKKVLSQKQCSNNRDIVIKTILIKRTEPLILKNILNTEHNRKLVCIALQNLQQPISDKYKLNSRSPGNYDTILKSWLKLFMLHHLKYHVFARLSNGTHGVAIKAIRNIPRETPIFENMGGHCALYYPIDVAEDEYENHVHEATNIVENINGKQVQNDPIKELLNDFFLQLNGNNVNFPIPALGPNMIDMSFFLNHACPGNVEIAKESYCDMSSYIAREFIEKDKILTINYAQFALGENGDIDKTKLLNLINRMPFLADLPPFKGYFSKNQNKYDITDDNLKNLNNSWQCL